ncbi:class II aldolase/adducin family protein [Pseudomonas oryzihabitans]|uniref:class II aldolase/adducin family protein n=1 Tax=Pseudomonas oryzihabitans TaxID=47885 RepID=UPI00286318A1|nr:class II aldolase/adducin family protein [Pseudomonas psychrotolerans]MDR6676680.1 rhamnose utilization protein RhaD (predicted bifunctional aldolase and dehydrogenase) [Pseudomonas psychrotolerans]
MSYLDKDTSKEVRCYCAKIGADPLLVQGAGGNASWKEGDVLWVKASGTWLANSEKEDIFVPVDLASLSYEIEKGNYSTTAKVIDTSNLRPSIETILHALMPHRIVMHLHAVEILAHLVRVNLDHYIDDLMKDSISFAVLTYSKPGAELACEIHEVLKKQPMVDVLFLKSHGVVIGGNSVQAIDRILNKLLKIFSTSPLFEALKNSAVYSIPDAVSQRYVRIADNGIQQLALNPNLFKRLSSEWVLYPDHVVFLGPQAYAYSSWSEFYKETDQSQFYPELFFIYGEGVYSALPFTKAKLVQLRCYYDVLVRQAAEIELAVLNQNHIAELLNWDAERYRMSLAK